MCKVIDNVLPIVGGIVGTIVGGPVGGAIGAGLGGFAGNYAQNHNFGGALLSGGISAGASALGGSLAQGLGGAGAGASDSASAFSGGLGNASDAAAAGEIMGLSSGAAQDMAAQTAINTGSLESGLGGAGMFGINAGTGTVAGQDLAGSLGGTIGGNGIADTTGSGIVGGGFTAPLGGGSGALGQSNPSANPAQQAAPQPQDLSQAVSANPTNMGSGAVSGEGAVGGASSNAAGTNPALLSQIGMQQPDTQGLGSLYGPNSVASQSPMGSAITGDANATAGVGDNVSFSSIPGTGSAMGDDGFQWNSPQGLSTLFKLGQTGLGAYQQYRQGQLANNYANQIDQLYSPNGAYAQQMQQELARKDAAAGRNSQYGSRAVQLAAALTQAHSQALANPQYAQARQNNSGASMLNGLFANFGSPQAMQGLYGLGQAGYNGLAGLFS